VRIFLLLSTLSLPSYFLAAASALTSKLPSHLTAMEKEGEQQQVQGMRSSGCLSSQESLPET
jgi:hypothetical protein